ncbi:MAG TPA: hypothetical protein VI365_12925, partial [Trebonia sp.]
RRKMTASPRRRAAFRALQMTTRLRRNDISLDSYNIYPGTRKKVSTLGTARDPMVAGLVS